MLESIAGAAMDMSAARFSVEYSMAVTKKVMDTQELAARPRRPWDNILTSTPDQKQEKSWDNPMTFFIPPSHM